MTILTKIKNIIQNLIKLGVVTLPGDDLGQFNRTQVSYLGKTKKVTVFMPYGLDANLPANSLVLLFNVMGQEENIVGIGTDPANRFKGLAPGEVAVGSPKTGSKIYFKANGDIDVESDGVVTLNGNSEPLVRGNALKTYNDLHVHPDPVSGFTGPPSVVMPTSVLSTKNFTE